MELFVLDSFGQFWTVKDGLNLVLDTVRPKPSFGRPKPNPDYLPKGLTECTPDVVLIKVQKCSCRFLFDVDNKVIYVSLQGVNIVSCRVAWFVVTMCDSHDVWLFLNV